MPKLFNGNMLWVDLTNGALEEREIDEDLLKRRIGGASLISSLTPNESIGLASGPLTGLPAPACGMAVACVENSRKHRFAPLLLNAGLDLKLTGFDAIVIEGRSESPVYLWMRDEVADLISADKIVGQDCWETISSVRKEQGDQRIQVISAAKGPSACLDFVSGWDGIGFGASMNAMNLKAIAFRGMGEVSTADPVRTLEKSSSMIRDSAALIGNRSGIGSLVTREIVERLGPLGRTRACYSCPYPCMNYADTGDPKFKSILLMDQITIGRLANRQEKRALTESLVNLHRNGYCIRETPTDSENETVQNILARPERLPTFKGTFDTFTDGVGEYDLIAAGYVLGICPRFLGLIQPPLTSYIDLLTIASGEAIPKENVVGLGNSLMMEGEN